jgi:hypothetical protein
VYLFENFIFIFDHQTLDPELDFDARLGPLLEKNSQSPGTSDLKSEGITGSGRRGWGGEALSCENIPPLH